MEPRKIHLGPAETFCVFALFWIIWGWLALLSAASGFFYGWISVLYFLAASITLGYFIYAKKISLVINQELAVISGLAALVILFYSFFVSPSVFSGRDQGSISEAAIRLSQNHQLKFSSPAVQEFYEINSVVGENYEKCLGQNKSEEKNFYYPISIVKNFACEIRSAGKALNFPGFYYVPGGQLLTQFPLPYIAWLASFYAIFGLSGLIIGNAVLFFIFFVSSYYLLRFFLPKKLALAGIVFLACSFPIFWFYKFTLSENMALALFWFGVYSLLRFRSQRSDFNYAIIVAVFSLLMFTRIEGFLIFLMLAIWLFFGAESRNYIFSRKRSRLFAPAFVLFFIFLFILRANYPFFKEIARVFFATESAVTASGWLEKIIESVLHCFNVFATYAILPYFVLGIAGIIILAKKKEWEKLIPLLLVSPTLIYFLDSHISPDHPWMLRRYVFSIIPVFLLYTFIFLNNWLEKKKKILAFSTLFVVFLLHAPLMINFCFFSENKNLLKQTAQMAKNFSSRDLVLVDRLTTGDGWSMISGPLSFLHNRQAVYVFNYDDVQKINLDKFEKVFLIIPEENAKWRESESLNNKMRFSRDYFLETRRIETETCPTKLPRIANIEIKGEIFEIEK